MTFKKVVLTSPTCTHQDSAKELKAIIDGLGVKCEVSNEFDGADLVISLGGDGSFIRTAQKLIHTNTPITGINYGTLGFLTEINKNEDLVQHLKDILLNGKYYTKNYTALSVTTQDKTANVINDIIITNHKIGKFTLYVDGKFVYNAKADGLVVSSPTGSTGRSLTAGGPIIAPTCEVILITLICPLTLTNRPLILSKTSSITIKIQESSDDYEICYDGDRMKLPSAEVSVHAIASGFQTLHHSSRDIFSNYRKKLGWHS